MSEISVIICTYNRCGYLPELIESLSRQTIDKESFEILVIDNNSTDETKTTIKNFQKTMPNLGYVLEPEQGLSIARNRGLEEAKSEIVAYIDDDAYAEPRWLASLLESFQFDDDIVCAGGPVELDWQGMRPDWLPVRFESIYTCLDFGPEKKYIDRNSYLVGANISFRRSWLLEQRGFQENLGRKGGCLLSGEEAGIYRKVFQADKKAFYHPGSRICHRVLPERRRWRWFLRRLFWDGATQPLLDLDKVEFRETNLIRRILYDVKMCIFYLFLSLSRSIQGRKKEAFLQFLGAVQKWGRVAMELRFLFDPEFAPLWKNRWR